MEEANKIYFGYTKTSSQQLNSLYPSKSLQPIFEYNEWILRSINCLANSGKFSSDRTIGEYCDEIWDVEELSIPKGSTTPVQRLRSAPNLSKEDKIREKMNTT